LDHLLILASALERVDESSMSLLRVRKVVDKPGDIVVDDQWQIGLCGLQLFSYFGGQSGVGREGNFVGGVERRSL
jgi:hypothetical protein